MYKEIDYLPAVQQLKRVLYDVSLQPVYSDFKTTDSLFKKPISTNNYQAIVNQQNGSIISVVGSNYKLIPNNVALDMGKELFRFLYPHIKMDELIPFKVITPMSLASTQIDLIHKDVNLKVWEQETWLPFLRISNSYNRVHALTFEIGFVRKLCANGMLFKKKTLIIKYPHSKNNKINFETDAAKIKDNQDIFINQCQEMSEIIIPNGMMLPLVCKILNINLDIPEKGRDHQKQNRLEKLVHTVNILTRRYCKESEPNGYEALSVITDLISHQDDYKIIPGYHLNVRAYYLKPSLFIDTMIGLKHTGKLNLSDFLYPTLNKIHELQKYFEAKWIYN